jgi:hypothetical protein
LPCLAGAKSKPADNSTGAAVDCCDKFIGTAVKLSHSVLCEKPHIVGHVLRSKPDKSANLYSIGEIDACVHEVCRYVWGRLKTDPGGYDDKVVEDSRHDLDGGHHDAGARPIGPRPAWKRIADGGRKAFRACILDRTCRARSQPTADDDAVDNALCDQRGDPSGRPRPRFVDRHGRCRKPGVRREQLLPLALYHRARRGDRCSFQHHERRSRSCRKSSLSIRRQAVDALRNQLVRLHGLADQAGTARHRCALRPQLRPGRGWLRQRSQVVSRELQFRWWTVELLPGAGLDHPDRLPERHGYVSAGRDGRRLQQRHRSRSACAA